MYRHFLTIADECLIGSRSDVTCTSHDQTGDTSAESSPTRGRSAQYVPMIRKPTPSDMSVPSSLASDLRATAPEFVPTRVGTSTEEAVLAPPEMVPALPDMYSLDAFGLPWYYHMYPFQWSYPASFYNGRSRSPRKFYPRRQRQNFASPDRKHNSQHNTYPSKTEPPVTPTSRNPRAQLPSFQKPVSPMTLLEQNRNADFQMSGSSQPARVASSAPLKESSNSVDAVQEKADDGPFVHQMDFVNRQAAMHDPSETRRGSNVDLTKIHNIPAFHRYDIQHQGGSPSRNVGHRRGNNGLYDRCGVAGVPMSATAPFPSPMAPHGRPTQVKEVPTRYVGYTAGTDACGSVNIEVAAERGGDVCDACDSSL